MATKLSAAFFVLILGQVALGLPSPQHRHIQVESLDIHPIDIPGAGHDANSLLASAERFINHILKRQDQPINSNAGDPLSMTPPTDGSGQMAPVDTTAGSIGDRVSGAVSVDTGSIGDRVSGAVSVGSLAQN